MARQEIEFEGVIAGGHLPHAIRQKIALTMQQAEGKRIRVSLSEVKSRRSLSQNSYYWGVVIEHVRQMFADAGQDIDKEEAHDFLKLHVGGLKDVVTDPAGVKHSVPRSSTRLTTIDWEVYMTKIRAWAAEFGCQIPEPNEVI
jgi:hypothetical protein